MDKNKLAAIIQRSSKTLCNSHGDRMVTEATMARHGKNVNNYDQDPMSFDDYQQFDDTFLNETSTRGTKDMYFTNEDIQNSRLPEALKQSFSEQRIDMNGTGGLSVLDSLPIEQPIQRQIKPQMLKEEINTPSYKTNGSIDYSIIKAIVNECLKEYFDRQNLNESCGLKTIVLKEGNISLVDNKGNIYKAKLEKIGNKNDKK